MKKRKFFLATILMAAYLLILTGCGKQKIDVMETLTLNYSGADGYGKAEIENAYDWEADALEKAGIEKIEDFSSLGGALTIEMSVSYDVFPNENLSNGDEVTVTATVNNEAVEEYDIEFVAKEKKFTVEGLPEIMQVDLFENIEIEFQGIAPNVTASITDANTDYYVYTKYSLDKSKNLNIGDTITIKADYDKAEMLEKGYMAKSDTKEVEVTNVAKYVTELSEIPEDILEKMKNQMTDAMKAHVASKWAENESMKQMKYLGSYFLKLKNGMTNNTDYNLIYLVYKIDVENSENKFSYYSYCKFKNLVILEDGTCSIDLSDYNMPYGSSFFGVTGEAFAKGSYWYTGYEQLDSLFNNCVTANIEYYEYESDVIG